MVIIDKHTGEALLGNGSRVGPQRSLKDWFENSLAAGVVYWVNDSVGSPKRRPGGGPQRFAYDELPDRLGWYWVWFSTAVFVRGGYRMSATFHFEGGALHAVRIDARLESRAALQAPKEWPEYSAEDERDQWDILKLDFGEPNGRLMHSHRPGKTFPQRSRGYSFQWGDAWVGRDPHMNTTSIIVKYSVAIAKASPKQ